MQNNVPTYGLICPLGDVDFQLIQNGIQNSTIMVTLDQLPADYDLELKDAAGNILAGSYNPGLTPEVIVYQNAPPGNYYPTIQSNVGQWNPGLYFRLTAVITPPPPPVDSPAITSRSSDELVSELKIYPNPAQDRVTLSFNNLGNEETMEVKIVDLLGRVIKTKIHSILPELNQIEIDISDIENGSYFIQSGNEKLVRKGTQLIIQH